MTRKQKKTLYRILIAFVLFVVCLLLPTVEKVFIKDLSAHNVADGLPEDIPADYQGP